MEPIAESTIHEGGAPPEAPEAPDSFESLDGSLVEKTKPTPRPRRSKPVAEPGAEEPPSQPAEAKPEGQAQPQLRRGQRPGESEPDYWDRMAREQTARAIRAEETASIAREQGMQAAQEIQRLNSMLEPLLRREWERARLEEERQRMAAIPDREAQPEQYAAYQAEEAVRLIQEERALRDQERLAWQQQQEEMRQAQERQAQLGGLDGSWGQEIQALAADPEADRAYQAFLYSSVNSLRNTYPDASDEQIQELAWGSNVILNRELKHSGIPLADYYRSQLNMMRQTLQLYETGFGAAGQPPAAPAMTVAGTPKPIVKPGSPTAARVAAEAQRARAAQAVSAGGSPGRAGGMPGESLNPALFETDDDYVTAALAGEFDTNRFIQTLGRARKR